MPDYDVEWLINIEDTDDPKEAAQQAWEALRADGSIANAFVVSDAMGWAVSVDLHEDKVGKPVWVPSPPQVADLAEWMTDQDWPVSEVIRMIRSPHKYATEYTAMITEAEYAKVATEPEIEDTEDTTL